GLAMPPLPDVDRTSSLPAPPVARQLRSRLAPTRIEAAGVIPRSRPLNRDRPRVEIIMRQVESRNGRTVALAPGPHAPPVGTSRATETVQTDLARPALILPAPGDQSAFLDDGAMLVAV